MLRPVSHPHRAHIRIRFWSWDGDGGDDGDETMVLRVVGISGGGIHRAEFSFHSTTRGIWCIFEGTIENAIWDACSKELIGCGVR